MLLILTLASSITNGASQSKEGASVFFILPKDGQTVKNPIQLSFGLEGMKLVEAGINSPYSGHHHLLINVDQLPDLNSPIPADNKHIHFGKGQSTSSINLEPGYYTFQLLFADYLHIPHDKPLISKKISIEVVE
tara:strand:+ start:60 stop:461 length:402 start_codon:yes stop_codon:yes gene_type:complete